MAARNALRTRTRTPIAEAGFEALFEEAVDAILLVDPDTGEIVRANAAVERFLGYAPARIAGRHFSMLFPAERWRTPADLLLEARAGAPIEYAFHRADGGERWMDLCAVLIPWGSGQMLVATLRDAGERVRSRTALAVSRERLEVVLRGADLGLWDWTVATGEVSCNARAAAIVGHPADDVESDVRTWQALLHPDDRDAVMATIRRHLRGETADYESEHRLRHRQGQWVWVLHRGRVVSRGADGRAERVAGTLFDISDRKRSEQERHALLEMAKELCGSVDLHEMVAAAEQRTLDVLPADVVATLYWDPEHEGYRFVSLRGFADEIAAAAREQTYTFTENFGGRLGCGDTIVADAVLGGEPRDMALLTGFGVRALAAVPLIIRGQVRGAFCVGHRSQAFTAAQVHFLEGIAHQLAVAVETAALYRAQQAETEHSAALARVGRELISALTTPEVYERLCAAAATALGVEVCATFLWNAREEAYAAVASHGDSAERWEELRAARLTAAMVEGLIAGLGATGLVRLGELPGADPVRRRLLTAYELQDGIVVALRRSDELIGFLCAGYRGGGAVSTQQERTARSIAQVASLALDNARLVEELERANRIKSDFVATMSHELRTPLNVVIGYHDLLLEGEFGPLSDEQAERLRRADESARELLDLINATLDLSRLESRQVPLQLQQLDLGDMIEALTGELSALRQRSGVRFVWSLPPSLPRLYTDPLKLKVVLKNLLHNAFKFTESGAVTVSVGSTPEHVSFEVADTGVGIERELLAVIFEPFRQADSSSTRSYGGVGLGLFIVKRLLDVLGGGIEVESEVGRGSRFRFWLPRHLPQ